MSNETQAVLLNAVPLFALAAVYLAVTATLVPPLWRDRADARPFEWALAAVFPATAVFALLLGAVVLYDRKPLGSLAWPSFAAILVALIPAAVVVARWRERDRVVGGARLAREAAERVSLRDRELGALAAISNAL
ncbi:MAG: hypothetical protein ACXVZL_04125, partial [Gaiellaceae bacterium]